MAVFGQQLGQLDLQPGPVALVSLSDELGIDKIERFVAVDGTVVDDAAVNVIAGLVRDVRPKLASKDGKVRSGHVHLVAVEEVDVRQVGRARIRRIDDISEPLQRSWLPATK